MKRLFARSALAACLTLLSVASYGQNPIPISFVPAGIGAPGTYILTQDWTDSSSAGSAINVTANDVTIDLNGHHISCTIPNNQLVGVHLVDVSNVSVKNGEISGFQYGVFMDHSGTSSNVDFGNLVDSLRLENNQYGVACLSNTGCVVRNCQIEGGWMGVGFGGGEANHASNNLTTGAEFGYYGSGPHYFDSNYANKCAFGIYATSSATKLRFNTTTNCNTAVVGGTSELALDQ